MLRAFLTTLCVLVLLLSHGARADTPPPPLAVLIADLGAADPKVRMQASAQLEKVPRPQVLNVAAALASGKMPPPSRPTQLFAVPAVALGLLSEWKDERAVGIALGQVKSSDADVRECAVSILSPLQTEAVEGFFADALAAWGADSTSGERALFRALDEGDRLQSQRIRGALLAFLSSPLPPASAKFHYLNPHDPPHTGDLHRCWLYKADACLYLLAHHPFAEAQPAAERLLSVAEVRVSAAMALSAVAGYPAYPTVRSWLAQDQDTEHRLGLYRALFLMKADSEEDRQAARDLFTATAAPSTAWVAGLGAMVTLFESRADVPALRVVSGWKLVVRGKATEHIDEEAIRMRDTALQVMHAAHPDVYEEVLKP